MKKHFALTPQPNNLVLAIFAVFLAIIGAAFTGSPLPFANNNLTNPFNSCQCTSMAYEAAPTSIQRLIRWTQGEKFDNYPQPPSWVSWNATQWPENIKTYGPKLDPNLDWAGSIDHTPDVGAIVVYPGNSKTTWIVGKNKLEWTFSSNGHVAVVTSYDSAKNTISTRDKNWGQCGPSSRDNVDVNTDMLFIHVPAPIKSGSSIGSNSQESIQFFNTQFYSKLPWRNIWISTRSKFELSIDGKLIISEDRPNGWSVFTKQRIFVSSFAMHTVAIKWWQVGSDPQPRFDQTWWPNVIVQAAEPDPTSSLGISYTYFIRPNILVKGQPASITVAASTDSAFTISSIDVFVDQNKIGTINGTVGTLNISTDSLALGSVKLRLVANVQDWPGVVADHTVDITVTNPIPLVTTTPPLATITETITEALSNEIGIPSQLKPSDGSSFKQTKDVTLSWNPSANAVQYKIALWGGPYSKMTSCDWQAGTSCHIGQMWPGTMSWHVKARNSFGQESDWSPTWFFTIQQSLPNETETSVPSSGGLGMPTLSRPANGDIYSQSADIALSWNTAPDATQYKVELWGGPYSNMIPCDWQNSTTCHIGQMWPGTMSWHVKARNSSGQESDWSPAWNFTINPVETHTPPPPVLPSDTPVPQPAYVQLVDDLSLRTESGNWPPQAGEKIIAHIKIHNSGDLSLHIEHLGVRGRRNGSEFWDIGFWTADLNGHQEWSLDPNNERPLVPGNYSFRISYSLDGSNWTEIGNEINFSVR